MFSSIAWYEINVSFCKVRDTLYLIALPVNSETIFSVLLALTDKLLIARNKCTVAKKFVKRPN